MFWNVTSNLLKGFSTSLEVFFFTLLFAIPLGLIISFGTMSKWAPLRGVMRVFVWIIRGTPLMLQLFVFAYYNLFLPFLPPCTFDKRIYIAIIAFVINYACYFSEIFRAGIESMPKGQYEACAVLGMNKKETFFKVILFQVVKKIVPPMGNEIITLVKDTSLVRVIMVYELMWEAEKFLIKGLLWPIFYTGVFYLLFSGLLTLLFGYLEKKMSYYRE
ncbi:MAG: amino acid ABC transporter permease [Clostridia bacterium]|nr:amino acid ABC transporter permease [Clostridia bacterium]